MFGGSIFGVDINGDGKANIVDDLIIMEEILEVDKEEKQLFAINSRCTEESDEDIETCNEKR